MDRPFAPKPLTPTASRVSLSGVGECESPKETRRAPRFQIRAPTEYTDDPVGRGMTANLSMSGALIQSPARVDVGTQVGLRFSFFPGSFEIEFQGTVVRHSEEGFAVQFVELDEHQLELLHRALPPSATA